MDSKCSQLVNLNILYTIEVLDVKTHFHIRSGCLRKQSYVTELIWGVAVHDVTLTSGQWHLSTPPSSLFQHGIFPSMDAFCPDLLYWVRLPHFLKQLYFWWKVAKCGRQKPMTRNVGAQSTTSGINHAKTKRQVWDLVRGDLLVSESCG